MATFGSVLAFLSTYIHDHSSSHYVPGSGMRSATRPSNRPPAHPVFEAGVKTETSVPVPTQDLTTDACAGSRPDSLTPLKRENSQPEPELVPIDGQHKIGPAEEDSLNDGQSNPDTNKTGHKDRRELGRGRQLVQNGDATSHPRSEAGGEPARQGDGGDESDQGGQNNVGGIFEVVRLARHRVDTDTSTVDFQVEWVGGGTSWESERELQLQVPQLVLAYWAESGSRDEATGLQEYHVLRILDQGATRPPLYRVHWVGYRATAADTTWESKELLERTADNIAIVRPHRGANKT